MSQRAWAPPRRPAQTDRPSRLSPAVEPFAPRKHPVGPLPEAKSLPAVPVPTVLPVQRTPGVMAEEETGEPTYPGEPIIRYTRPERPFREASPSLIYRQPDRPLSLQRPLPAKIDYVQRDLRQTLPVDLGTFTTDLKTKTVSEPGLMPEGGLGGSISFEPGANAPDIPEIKLLQIVKRQDLSLLGLKTESTDKEVDKAVDQFKDHLPLFQYGAQDPRSVGKHMQTASGGEGVQEGFQVDHLPARQQPPQQRTKKTDPTLSPYYMDRVTDSLNKAGYKKGAEVAPAVLQDGPSSTFPHRLEFETVAKNTASGAVLGSLTWGFTVIVDGKKAAVRSEHAKAQSAASKTVGAALAKFDEYYKNPGSPAGEKLPDEKGPAPAAPAPAGQKAEPAPTGEGDKKDVKGGDKAGAKETTQKAVEGKKVEAPPTGTTDKKDVKSSESAGSERDPWNLDAASSSAPAGNASESVGSGWDVELNLNLNSEEAPT